MAIEDELMKILDIGCGWNKTKGAIGLDIDPTSHADVVHDFDNGLPFQDNEFDVVVMQHSLEHSKDIGKLIKECERVLKPNGVIEITVPTKRSQGYRWLKHNYFFEFEGRFGRTRLPVFLQKILGLFMANEMIIRIKRERG